MKYCFILHGRVCVMETLYQTTNESNFTVVGVVLNLLIQVSSLLKTIFSSIINMYVILFHSKNEINIHLEQHFQLFITPGSMVVVCLVQRSLEEIKQSNPLNVTLHIFRFENHCL